MAASGSQASAEVVRLARQRGRGAAPEERQRAPGGIGPACSTALGVASSGDGLARPPGTGTQATATRLDGFLIIHALLLWSLDPPPRDFRPRAIVRVAQRSRKTRPRSPNHSAWKRYDRPVPAPSLQGAGSVLGFYVVAEVSLSICCARSPGHVARPRRRRFRHPPPPNASRDLQDPTRNSWKFCAMGHE